MSSNGRHHCIDGSFTLCMQRCDLFSSLNKVIDWCLATSSEQYFLTIASFQKHPMFIKSKLYNGPVYRLRFPQQNRMP